ncbi:MAG: hypothetical protein M3409_00770 [Gemmatimonadota bacterium]|nr:hypothetical protein [Gemmatimonadota bacterium]
MTDLLKPLRARVRRFLVRAFPTVFVRVSRGDIERAHAALADPTDAERHDAEEAKRRARATHEAVHRRSSDEAP